MPPAKNWGYGWLASTNRFEGPNNRVILNGDLLSQPNLLLTDIRSAPFVISQTRLTSFCREVKVNQGSRKEKQATG
jgi:hypothetical protein